MFLFRHIITSYLNVVWPLPPGYTHIHIVPVIIAIASDLPPFEELAILSVQMKSEDQNILPMRKLKYDWVPYNSNLRATGDAGSRVFVLSCNQRRAANHQLSKQATKQYSYAIPYVFNPFKPQEEEDTTCSIPVVVNNQLKPYTFDWKYEQEEVCGVSRNYLFPISISQQYRIW